MAANSLTVIAKILPKVLNKSLVNDIQAAGALYQVSRVTRTAVTRVTSTGATRITSQTAIIHSVNRATRDGTLRQTSTAVQRITE